MMISNLPWELKEEILSRVPVTSLTRFQTTCKQWYNLFKDPRFIKKHFDNRQYQGILLDGNKVYSLELKLKGIQICFSFLFIDKLRLIHPKFNSKVKISRAFHSGGLLLCTTTTRDNSFLVWNLYSGETQWIKPRSDPHKREKSYALGYDNKELCPSFKILRFLDKYYQTPEIYESGSNSWRNLDDVSHGSYLKCSGVSLKGNTYWNSKRKGIKDYFLLSFDFSTERFQDLGVLPFEATGYCDDMLLSVVREERISLFYQSSKTTKIEIWLSNEIESITTFVSWSKFLTVDHHMSLWPMSFFIDEMKKIAVCCSKYSDEVYLVEEEGIQPCYSKHDDTLYCVWLCSKI